MRSFALLLLAAWPMLDTAAAQDTQASIQGNWQIVALQDGGRTAPAEVLEGAERVITGDLIVQNDTVGIGHVSMILDVCRTGSGETLNRIGYRYMPA